MLMMLHTIIRIVGIVGILLSFIIQVKSMSFHTLAWSSTVAQATAFDVVPIPDQNVLIQNGHFVFQQDVRLLYASWMHAVAGQAQFITPSLRLITAPRQHNLIRAVQPATFPQLQDYRRNPLSIKKLEELQLSVTNAAATSGVGTGVAGIDTGNMRTAQAGQTYVLRGTSTVAAVANTWTLLSTIVWSDSLPNGRYAVTGGVVASANAQAFRLRFQNQLDRPGGLSQVSEFLVQNGMFLDGGLQEWGQFDNYAMPLVEVLVNGTDASHVILLDITRIAG